MNWDPLTVAARRQLLDALQALEAHREALVLVGSQAIYLHTGASDVAIATTTKDSDLVVVPQLLVADPTLDAALIAAGFAIDPLEGQPGQWASGEDSPPVELLVPEGLHEGGGRRGARIPPHSKRAARVVIGLEAAVISNLPFRVTSLEPEVDERSVEMKVATPAALVVSKAYKLGERAATAPDRLLDKDAHDLYRLLRASEPRDVARDLNPVLDDPIAGPVARTALGWLRDLSGRPEDEIPMRAGRTEELVGDPELVAASTAEMVRELLELIEA